MSESITSLMQGPRQQDPPFKKAQLAVRKGSNESLLNPKCPSDIKRQINKNANKQISPRVQIKKQNSKKLAEAICFIEKDLRQLLEGTLEFDKSPLAY